MIAMVSPQPDDASKPHIARKMSSSTLARDAVPIVAGASICRANERAGVASGYECAQKMCPSRV